MMAWVTGCVGEACRPDHVWARSLAAVTPIGIGIATSSEATKKVRPQQN